MSIVADPPASPPDSPHGSPPGPLPEPAKLPPQGTTKRLLLGCVIVLVASAATSAVFFLGQLGTLRAALSQNPSLDLKAGLLAPAGFGGAETLLLVGNDQRAHTTTTPVLPHSNEMLLVRIDPNLPWISMMSIPRELETTIYPPNAAPVTTRFNYAYTAGGIPLLVSTIKRVLGLPINHVIVIDFNQFKRAVDEIGCVYSTVDERYYHVNTPYSQQYQEINLQPGYQKMCGAEALQFVSYRHGDTSLVRDARDQSFLLDVKNEYGPALVDNVGTFEHIFGQTVRTDPGLHTNTGILNLLGTLISSSARTVRKIQFQVNLQPTGANPCSCDTASQQQISSSVHSFLYGQGAPPTQSTAAVARAAHRDKAAPHLPLAATSAAELAQARATGATLPFPLEYPRVRDQLGSAQPVDVRDYTIHAPGGASYPAYVEVFSNGQLGQYYDVQGMAWTTAPQFDNPGQTIHVAGRTYYLYYEGQRLKMVAWYQHGAVYWIRNTLLDSVGNGELLAIAEQTIPVSAAAVHQAPARLTLRAATAPIRTPVPTTTDLTQTIGSLGGLLTLAAVPLLGIMLIKRRRDLAAARARLGASLQRVGAPAFATPRPTGVSAPAYTYTYARVNAGARPRLSTSQLVGGGAATIAIAGALALLLSGGLGSTAKPRARPSAAAAAAVRAVPVAVLNASGAQGAAGRLAHQLRSRRVKIATVGNLSESRPPGLWILYPPGERGQAARLAHLLAARGPTLAPIDPVAQAAAGSAVGVVAVIA